MSYYRLYHLSPTTGHIDRVEEFEATDDAAAVARVRDGSPEVAVELWQESRKLLHLPAPAKVAQPGEPLGNRPAFGA